VAAAGVVFVVVAVDLSVAVDVAVELDAVDAAQDAKTNDVTMRQITTTQNAPLFI
jgi:hypothetical protein